MQSILLTELVYAEFTVYWVSSVYAELYYSLAHYLPSSGYIGKLKLQIPPVRYIKSQPWVVRIDQLYIVAGPPQSSDVSWQPVGCQWVAMLYSAFSIWLHSSWSRFNGSGVRSITCKSWTKDNTSSIGKSTMQEYSVYLILAAISS